LTIAIHSDSFDDQLKHFGAVFAALRSAGLTLRLEKCNFARSTISYLGHNIGSGTHQPGDKKVQAVRDMTRPKTKKDLQSFLGLCNYYRNYVQAYSEIALPLTKLTKAKLPMIIEWGLEQQNAFETLKLKLCAQPVLRTPAWDRPFIVQADASDYAVGACLAQNFLSSDGIEEEHPIAYASCKFTDTQRNWATIEKEAYAVIYALKQFDIIIYGMPVIIYSDHNPLKYLSNNAPKSPKLTRWCLSLQRYNYEIKHRKGCENANCDALSRLI
jgi:hypothetical protein